MKCKESGFKKPDSLHFMYASFEYICYGSMAIINI